MQLTIFNGSPRGRASNSTVLIQWLIAGLEQRQDVKVDTHYLNKVAEHDAQVSCLQQADIALIVFPLYADGMPGLVMAFIEKLDRLCNSLQGLKLGFIVHSGFPEAIHSRAIERYLEWLVAELGAQYAGTIVMGGSEGMRYASPKAAKPKMALFDELGSRLVSEGKFPSELVKQAAGMERFPPAITLLLKLASKTRFFQSMWDSQLKANGAYNERSAKPYEM